MYVFRLYRLLLLRCVVLCSFNTSSTRVFLAPSLNIILNDGSVDDISSLPRSMFFCAPLAIVLAQSTTLTQVIMSGCGLTDVCLQCLVPLFFQCNSLEHLDLSNNGFSDMETWSLLADALHVHGYEISDCWYKFVLNGELIELNSTL